MLTGLRSAFNSVRVRLLTSFLILIVIPLLLLGGFMLRTLDQFYTNRLLDDMSAEAALISEGILADLENGLPDAAANLVNNPPPPLRAQVQVVVFDSAGKVVAASNNFVATPQAEPGLAAALDGAMTRGVEQSPALAAPVAYVTQPIVVDGSLVGVIHLAYPLAQLQSDLSTLQVWLVVGIVLVMILALMTGLELARRITLPLDQLRAATANIAGGHFDHRVSEAGPTELASVARDFNTMAAELQIAEQSRQAMFANLAHDVRTPLGSIRAAVEALAAGAHEQPELRAKLLQGLITQTNYVRRLTDDLLRLASYEGGGLIVQRTRTSINTLLHMATDSFIAPAARRNITLQVTPGAGDVFVQADADRLLEALLNLLDNALSYTPSGGVICLAAEAAHHSVTVHVRDNGPGIPAEVLPVIFERFRRGDLRRSGSGLHMGLGLNIAQAILHAHGSRLSAANLPGGGADFYFSLPLA